jgi:hypothetical protein
MSSALDHLVPVLNGTNWREWEVTMTAYLQMQELWEVVSQDMRPRELQSTEQIEEQSAVGDTSTQRHHFAIPVTEED